MRKHSKRRARPVAAPTLVYLHTIPEVEIFILSAVAAFRDGYATPAQFDVLLDTRDLLHFGAIGARDEAARKVAVVLHDVLSEIRATWDGENFPPISQDTLNALELLADISIDFWKRQSGVLYQMAYRKLKSVRKMQMDYQKDTGKDERNEDQRGNV
jgi:hypothetical protein